MTSDDATARAAAPASPPPPSPTPFHDLDEYVALPRLGGLALSPDGRRLVTSVFTLDRKRTAYVSALWEVDATGEEPARRLTRSAEGEASATFTAAGDVLFTSKRPDPDATDGDDPRSALWLLPAAGGEARVIATAPAGLSGPLAAAAAPVVSVAADVLPSARDLDHDGELRRGRKDAKVSAILHSAYPIRHWDHDLGPGAARRFVGDLTAPVDAPAQPLPGGADPDDAPDPRLLALRDLTGPGTALRDHAADLSADGTTLVTTWQVAGPGPTVRSVLVAVDTATGERRTLVDDPGADLRDPVVSPDGAWVAFVRETLTTPQRAPEVSLAVVPLRSPEGDEGHPRTLAAHWDRWPTSAHWLPDGSGLVVTADDDGRGPVFLVAFDAGATGQGPGPAGGATAGHAAGAGAGQTGAGHAAGGADGTVERITSDDATFTDIQASRDGTSLYALRSSYLEPPHPVRIDLARFLGGGEPGARPPIPATALPGPVATPDLPGTLADVETAAGDDVRVRGWLALPHGTDADHPAPLLLWIHGGPLGSWNAWSWRWNPWLMVARGYAVLLPDPALSTGYGRDFVQRGWGSWGAAPYTDLLAITDHVEAFPEIDETRTAAMGGSFGGYMANWVAGHTDRFRAIVTHASLWALDQFGPTTDHSYYWQREMTPQMAEENSPHRFVGKIVTPMLVVHGDKDYRVPIGEGLRLWYDLLSASGLPAGPGGETVHRFLYYPDENHWVLSPQHAKVWYQVVWAFLAEHVLGVPVGEGDTKLPPTLG